MEPGPASILIVDDEAEDGEQAIGKIVELERRIEESTASESRIRLEHDELASQCNTCDSTASPG